MLTAIVIGFILLGLLWVAVWVFRLVIELFPLFALVILILTILCILN